MMADKPFIFRFEDVVVREREFSLTRAGERLAVEPKAFRVLLILLRNPGKLIPKQELLDAVWGDAAVTENSLARAVALLRKLLGDEARTPKYIETVATVGYRFLGSVEAVEDPTAVAAQVEPDAAAPATRGVFKEPGREPASSRWKIAVAAAAAIMALAGAYWYLSRPLPPPRITGVAQITRDGRSKDLRATDGIRLYFNLLSPNAIAQVSVNGGEIAEVPISIPKRGLAVSLKDVSRDGSSALVELEGGNEEKNSVDSLWVAPILGGPAKRLDSGWNGNFSPDGSRVIYSTGEGDIFLSRSDGTEKRKLANVGAFPYWFRWSPNGKTIRFIKNDGTLWEMNPDGSTVHRLLQEQQGFLCCGEWTTDGSFYLFNLYNSPSRSELWAIDERRRLFGPRPSAPIRLTIGPIQWGESIPSRDGNTIFARGTTPRGELSRIDPKTGSLQPYLGGISAEFVSFSPDGKSVAYVLFPEGTLWRADRDGSNRVQLTQPPNQVINPRWSPDSKQILFQDITVGQQHSSSYLVSAEGGIPRKLLPGDDTDIGDANWSPDGTRIVFDWGNYLSKPEEHELRIIDLGSRKIQTVPGSAGFWSVRWSPDGRYLAALAYPLLPMLRVFDLKSEHWTALPVSGDTEFPWFSHDSRYIYFLRPRHDQGVFRIPVTGGREERVVDMTNWHLTGYIRFSMTLDPNDAPLVLRDVGTDDIYALTLEAK